MLCMQAFGTWTEFYNGTEVATVPFDYSDPFSVIHYPTPQPSPLPTPTPSAPSPEPTSVSTITVAISFTLTSSSEPTAADKANLKTTLSDDTDIAEEDIKNFEVTTTSSTGTRRLQHRNFDGTLSPSAAGLETMDAINLEMTANKVAAGSQEDEVAYRASIDTKKLPPQRRATSLTWNVNSALVTDLSTGAYTDSSAFVTAVSDVLTSSNFATNVATNVETAVEYDTTSVTVYALTRNPSSSPTLPPSRLPSPMPSKVPMPLPSPRPSAQPTQQPFAVPSMLPSSEPSPQPSPLPSPSPTAQFVGTTTGAMLAIGITILGACLVSVALVVRRVGQQSAEKERKKEQRRQLSQSLETPGETSSLRLAGRLAQARPSHIMRDLYSAQNTQHYTLRDSTDMPSAWSPLERGNQEDDDNRLSLELAPGWQSALDPSGSGKTYYYHEITGKTQWDPPLVDVQDDVLDDDDLDLSDNDEEMKDSDTQSIRSFSMSSSKQSMPRTSIGGGISGGIPLVGPRGVLGAESDSEMGSEFGDEEAPPLSYAEKLKQQARQNLAQAKAAKRGNGAAKKRESAASKRPSSLPAATTAALAPARLPGRASAVATNLHVDEDGGGSTLNGPMATLDESSPIEEHIPAIQQPSPAETSALVPSSVEAQAAETGAARRPSRLASRLAASQLEEEHRGRRSSLKDNESGPRSRPSTTYTAPVSPTEDAADTSGVQSVDYPLNSETAVAAEFVLPRDTPEAKKEVFRFPLSIFSNIHFDAHRTALYYQHITALASAFE